jgi:hypothetical protein
MEPENTSNSVDGSACSREVENQKLASALRPLSRLFLKDSLLFVLRSFMQDSASP